MVKHNQDSIETAYSRRGFLSGSGAALASTVLLAKAQPALAQGAQSTGRPRGEPPAPGTAANNPTEILAAVMWDLVAANRIIAQHNIIDGEGHVSVRNPINSDTYLMGAFLPPQLVTLDNLVELDLDSRPLDTRGRPLEGERFIHGAIYRARPDVQAVIHFHDPSCVLMADSGEALRPLYHDAGFIGLGIPVFEIRDFVGDDTNLLVSNLTTGRGLVQVLGDHPGVLMRGHGATITGNNLVEATARAIYLSVNCELQSRVLGTQVKMKYLSPGESRITAHHSSKHDGGFSEGFGKDWAIWEGQAMSDYRPDSGVAT